MTIQLKSYAGFRTTSAAKRADYFIRANSTYPAIARTSDKGLIPAGSAKDHEVTR